MAALQEVGALVEPASLLLSRKQRPCQISADLMVETYVVARNRLRFKEVDVEPLVVEPEAAAVVQAVALVVVLRWNSKSLQGFNSVVK